jgi:acyl-[acyl-carrier-protein]-phospholipid O-acyltransferase/long-chain-fatty-acid--[acyl-carrier-protein] ligase
MVVSLVAVEAAEAHAGFYLSLASALLVLPYLLFSGYAGHLADVHSKRAVMLLCKVAEIVIMGAGLLILASSGTIEALLAMLFLMAAHETFFSPSKYGCVPEIVAEGDITRANGVLEGSRYAAVIAGTVTGGILMEVWSGERYRIGLLAIAIAIGGFLLAQRIEALKSACGPRPWPRHPWSQLPKGLRRLGRSRTIGVAAASITYFDGMATFVLLNALLWSNSSGCGRCGVERTGRVAAVGKPARTLLCGRISGPKIELGIVPLAGLGLAAVLAVLAASANDYTTLAGLLFALGLFGGLFFLLPRLAPTETCATEKGLILSTTNMLSMAGVLSASTGLWLLHDVIGLSPRAIFVVAAVGTVSHVLATLAISREIRSRVFVIARAIGRSMSICIPQQTN